MRAKLGPNLGKAQLRHTQYECVIVGSAPCYREGWPLVGSARASVIGRIAVTFIRGPELTRSDLCGAQVTLRRHIRARAWRDTAQRFFVFFVVFVVLFL